MVYSREQWISLGVMYSGILFLIGSVTLILPFYPVHERGVTPLQFGWLIGGYFLVKCVMCHVVGKYIHRLGIKFTLSAGSFLAGGSFVLFGMLAYISEFSAFLGESYATYYMVGVGAALIFTSSTALVTNSFPNNVGAVFAGIHISSAVGQILGPLVGGALYTIFGYTITFMLFGSLLLLNSLVAACALPTKENEIEESSENEVVGQTIIFRHFRTVKFLVSLIGSVFIVSLFGVNMVFFLEPLTITKLLIIQSAAYALSSWLSGWVCDRWLCPNLVSAAGSALTMLSVLLQGAEPIVPLLHNVFVQHILANALLGIGAGAQLVASFSGIWSECLAMGIPDNLSTKGIVSGGWNTIFCVGFFVGNSLCGALLQNIGDYWTSLVVFILGVIVFILNSLDLIKQKIINYNSGYRTIP